MEVKEFNLIRDKTNGCCGMEFHYFYDVPAEFKFSYDFFAEKLALPPNVSRKATVPWFIKPIVLVTAKSDQPGPYNLAKWLKEQGEVVVETPEVTNYSSHYTIKSWYWIVSEDFKKRVHEAYEKKYGKCEMPRPLTMAVANHDWRLN